MRTVFSIPGTNKCTWNDGYKLRAGGLICAFPVPVWIISRNKKEWYKLSIPNPDVQIGNFPSTRKFWSLKHFVFGLRINQYSKFQKTPKSEAFLVPNILGKGYLTCSMWLHVREQSQKVVVTIARVHMKSLLTCLRLTGASCLSHRGALGHNMQLTQKHTRHKQHLCRYHCWW